MDKQRLLVTGSAGFIFSNFVRKIIHEKHPYELYSIDKIASSSIMNNIYQGKSHEFYIADICDQHIMDRIFEYVKPEIVIHGAAESAVDKSINDPNIFINSNVLGTQVLINTALKYGVKNFVYQSCYDDQTRAVTRDGFKEWGQLKVGDKVLSINPTTKKVEEKEIQKIIIQDYSGDMLHFKSKRLDLLTTPNHRFITYKYFQHHIDNNAKLEWNTAEDLENGISCNNKYYLPIACLEHKSTKFIDLEGIGQVDAEALFYVCGVFIGDGFTAFQKKEVENKTGYSKKDYLVKCRDAKTGRFIGIKDIERGNQEVSICHSYRIFFDVPVNDKARAPLEKALQILNIEYSAHSGKAGEHIYVGSEKWMKFFESFGKYAHNKHIPNWMFDYGLDLLKSLWQGCHDSDGHGYNLIVDGKKRIVAIYTVSDKLTAQLCYLGSMIGYHTSAYRRHCLSYINGRKIEGDANYVTFANNRLPKIPTPVRQAYNGKIWCLSIKDNKNFLVERNGKIAFSGNTDEVYGALDNDNATAWTEEAPLNPKNPYSASKTAGELLVRAAANTHGLPFMITRSCNNYGPRQTADKLIPRAIKCLLENKKIPVYGEGKQIRDWLHTFDNGAAILRILQCGKIGETYNISANQEFTNIEVVKKICQIMGKDPSKCIEFIGERPGHDFRYSVNSTKLRNLGWAPVYKFEHGIERTISWYIENSWFLR